MPEQHPLREPINLEGFHVPMHIWGLDLVTTQADVRMAYRGGEPQRIPGYGAVALTLLVRAGGAQDLVEFHADMRRVGGNMILPQLRRNLRAANNWFTSNGVCGQIVCPPNGNWVELQPPPELPRTTL
jgi:hypothetical protein